MSADRLLSAVLLLRAHGRLTERELAEKLEVPEHTVRRDIEALIAAGVPVFARRGLQTAWQLDEDWGTQMPELDEVELSALLARQTGDGQVSSGVGRALGAAVGNRVATPAQRVTSIRQRLHLDASGWRATTEDLSMLPIVQDAVWQDRKLTFSYSKASERVERTVDPLGLVVKGNACYLVARTADGFRTYRVSRIQNARMLDQPSERPADFDLAAYWKPSTERFQDEVTRAMEAHRREMAERLEAERRAARELEIAKQVQARLFPQSLPQLRTLEYAGVCIQARQVGGDYYDFLDLGRQRLGIVVADIAGKESPRLS